MLRIFQYYCARYFYFQSMFMAFFEPQVSEFRKKNFWPFVFLFFFLLFPPTTRYYYTCVKTNSSFIHVCTTESALNFVTMKGRERGRGREKARERHPRARTPREAFHPGFYMLRCFFPPRRTVICSGSSRNLATFFSPSFSLIKKQKEFSEHENALAAKTAPHPIEFFDTRLRIYSP